MANRYMTKYSLVVIREIQIKATMIDHLTPIRMAIISSKNQKRTGGMAQMVQSLPSK
jgi:hypothetical protein